MCKSKEFDVPNTKIKVTQWTATRSKLQFDASFTWHKTEQLKIIRVHLYKTIKIYKNSKNKEHEERGLGREASWFITHEMRSAAAACCSVDDDGLRSSGDQRREEGDDEA